MEHRIQSIQEAAAYDSEKMVAPRNLWPPSEKNDKELEEWYESRDKLRQRKQKEPLDDDY